LRLTARDALEQVIGIDALRQHQAEEARKQTPGAIRETGTPEVLTRTDDEAREIADTPHLTGDPEFDAVELAETDPSRPRLKAVR